MGGHDKVVEIIEKTADKPVPKLADLDADAASVLTDKYISDRLNEVEVSLKDGELHLKYETSPLLKLIPLGNHKFVRGSSRYEFEVRDDQVVRLVQDDVFSARHYRPLVEERAADPAAAGAVDEQGLHVATTDWPGFRGLSARGIARDQNLPDRWKTLNPPVPTSFKARAAVES